MRLIDADALPWQVLWAWRAGEEVCAVTADDIDNVPTVCCAECEHWRPQDATGDPNDCCCGNEVLAGHMEHGCNPPARFGCCYFERRQT